MCHCIIAGIPNEQIQMLLRAVNCKTFGHGTQYVISFSIFNDGSNYLVRVNNIPQRMADVV